MRFACALLQERASLHLVFNAEQRYLGWYLVKWSGDQLAGYLRV